MTAKHKPLLFGAVLLTAAMTLGTALLPRLAVAEEVSFRLDVLPILNSRCLECHRPGGVGHEKSGLDLSSYEGLMKGTRFGPIVVPGEPLTSNLMVLIDGRADPAIRMPHKQRPLLQQQIAIVQEWVRQGAKDN